jgi:hypothetical protein
MAWAVASISTVTGPPLKSIDTARAWCGVAIPASGRTGVVHGFVRRAADVLSVSGLESGTPEAGDT